MPTPTPDQLRAWDKAFLDGLLYGVSSPYFIHLAQSENESENHTMQQAQQIMTDDLPNLGILIKLLKMTTSSNDGEALNAIRMANNALTKFGGDWERLLRGKVTVIGADPFDKIPDPPRAAPRPPPPPRPPPKPYTPPPPPTHTSYSQCSLIENYFDVLEFVTLSPAVQADINRINHAYRGSLGTLGAYRNILLTDFAFLETIAKQYIRKPRRGRP